MRLWLPNLDGFLATLYEERFVDSRVVVTVDDVADEPYVGCGQVRVGRPEIDADEERAVVLVRKRPFGEGAGEKEGAVVAHAVDEVTFSAVAACTPLNCVAEPVGESLALELFLQGAARGEDCSLAKGKARVEREWAEIVG